MPSSIRVTTLGAACGTVLFAACGGDARPRPPAGDTGGADAGPPVTLDAGRPIDPPPINTDATPPPVKPPLGDRAIFRGNVPAGADGWFGTATLGGGPGPVLAYPAPDTMFPPNIARILFQWTAPSGNVFRIHFETGKGALDVYTDGAHDTCAKAGTGGKCWESAADTLMPYLDAASGAKVDLTIAAIDSAMPSVVWQTPTYSVRVWRHRVGGAIYYWSTTVQGVRRGTLDGRDAGDYLTPPVAKGQCVACHTLSLSGKRLSIALPGDLLGLVDVVETVPPITFGPSTQGFPGQ